MWASPEKGVTVRPRGRLSRPASPEACLRQSHRARALTARALPAAGARVGDVPARFPSERLPPLVTSDTSQRIGLWTQDRHDFELRVKNCVDCSALVRSDVCAINAVGSQARSAIEGAACWATAPASCPLAGRHSGPI